MSAIRKLFSPWMALIAIVAVGTTTSAAKADLYLEVLGSSTSAVIDVTAADLAQGPYSGSLDYTKKTGYTIDYTVSDSTVAGQALKLTATLTDNGLQVKTAAGTTTHYLSETYTFALVSSTTTGSSSLPTGASSGFFASTAPSVNLYSTVKTFSTTSSGSSVLVAPGSNGAYGTTPQVAGFTSYDGSGNSQSFYANISGSNATTAYGPSDPESGNTIKLNALSGGSSFDLGLVAVAATGSGSGGKTSFTASTIVVPETSGLTAALAGLPCFGLLVGLVRRNRAQVAPVLAA